MVEALKGYGDGSIEISGEGATEHFGEYCATVLEFAYLIWRELSRISEIVQGDVSVPAVGNALLGDRIEAVSMSSSSCVISGPSPISLIWNSSNWVVYSLLRG